MSLGPYSLRKALRGGAVSAADSHRHADRKLEQRGCARLVAGKLDQPEAVDVPERLAWRSLAEHCRVPQLDPVDREQRTFRDAAATQTRERVAVMIDVDDLGKV